MLDQLQLLSELRPTVAQANRVLKERKARYLTSLHLLFVNQYHWAVRHPLQSPVEEI